jgi:hypothetical protein
MREKGTLYSKEQNQPSPGGSKDPLTDRYETCWEDITELEIASIQSCPIIPDYKTPTASTLPIVVQTPTASFCIDGWHFIEQAKTAGRSTIRCHIYHIKQHSDIELAIRKTAVRVMPHGGKCSYAELVRNTQQLYRTLHKTSSDDLVLFTHGGDRRGASFTSSRENNIRAVLVHRLGKSQTTINKYLQHGDGLNDAAMEELVGAGAPKLFFEAVQVPKQTVIDAQLSEQKDPAVIAEATSKEVMQWLAESQKPDPPSATKQEHPKAERSASRERPAPTGDQRPAARSITPQNDSGDNQDPPASDPTPADGTALTAELKRIGETLVGIADNQERPATQQIEIIRALIMDLSTLLQRFAHINAQNSGETGGTE